MPLHQRMQHVARSRGQRLFAGSHVFVQEGLHVVERVEITFGIQQPDNQSRPFGTSLALSKHVAGRPGDPGEEGRHGLFRPHQIIAAVFRRPQYATSVVCKSVFARS